MIKHMILFICLLVESGLTTQAVEHNEKFNGITHLNLYSIAGPIHISGSEGDDTDLTWVPNVSTAEVKAVQNGSTLFVNNHLKQEGGNCSIILKVPYDTSLTITLIQDNLHLQELTGTIKVALGAGNFTFQTHRDPTENSFLSVMIGVGDLEVLYPKGSTFSGEEIVQQRTILADYTIKLPAVTSSYIFMGSVCDGSIDLGHVKN